MLMKACAVEVLACHRYMAYHGWLCDVFSRIDKLELLAENSDFVLQLCHKACWTGWRVIRNVCWPLAFTYLQNGLMFCDSRLSPMTSLIYNKWAELICLSIALRKLWNTAQSMASLDFFALLYKFWFFLRMAFSLLSSYGCSIRDDIIFDGMKLSAATSSIDLK